METNGEEGKGEGEEFHFIWVVGRNKERRTLRGEEGGRRRRRRGMTEQAAAVEEEVFRSVTWAAARRLQPRRWRLGVHGECWLKEEEEGLTVEAETIHVEDERRGDQRGRRRRYHQVEERDHEEANKVEERGSSSSSSRANGRAGTWQHTRLRASRRAGRTRS
eukprot:763997-Hanusia_phi.AAC.5